MHAPAAGHHAACGQCQELHHHWAPAAQPDSLMHEAAAEDPPESPNCCASLQAEDDKARELRRSSGRVKCGVVQMHLRVS